MDGTGSHTWNFHRLKISTNSSRPSITCAQHLTYLMRRVLQLKSEHTSIWRFTTYRTRSIPLRLRQISRIRSRGMPIPSDLPDEPFSIRPH